MVSFYDVPNELYHIIAKYSIIQNIINISCTSKHFYNQIGKHINKYIYSTIDKNNTLDKVWNDEDLYTEYFRGKSYPHSEKGDDKNLNYKKMN